MTRSGLCVTEGAIAATDGAGLSVDAPKMRAYVNAASAGAAQLQFTYLGPTATQSALASGASRVQFGLKLRAADACNLIYVMWRVQPESKLVVSVKSNPGAHRSAECGNHGYQNIKPQSSAPVPAVAPGQMHTLRAIVTGSELQAWVDGRPVWRAQLGAVAGAMSGPAGVRSDDARLEFELAVDQAPAAAGALPGCRVGSEESE